MTAVHSCDAFELLVLPFEYSSEFCLFVILFFTDLLKCKWILVNQLLCDEIEPIDPLCPRVDYTFDLLCFHHLFNVCFRFLTKIFLASLKRH